MKRSGPSLTVLSICLVTFCWGCGIPTDSGVGTSNRQTTSVGQDHADGTTTAGGTLSTGETNHPTDVSEGQLASTEFNLASGAKPTDLFDKPAPKSHDTVVSSDGVVYEGEIAGGVPNGQGVSTDSRGTRQEGEWRNGKPYRVSGVWVDWDGTREEGTWNLDGTKCGGTIKWPDGRMYKGDWKFVDGAPESPDGNGTMTWPDGRKYTGNFQDGAMNGRGTMTYPDGKVEDGLWTSGRFVGPAK